MKNLAITFTMIMALVSVSHTRLKADGQNDSVKIEPKLTPAIAQAAIADLIRSKSCSLLHDLDADEWARKELKDEGKGTWSVGGLIYITPKEFKYSFTAMPKPGAQVCAITCEGVIKLQDSKWVAQTPEMKSFTQTPGK